MSSKTKFIHFILMGGTIDSFYDPTVDTTALLKNSVIPQYIKSLKLYEESKFTQVCMKDSRQLTPNDLKKALKTIEKSQSKRIIITHGTYTMSDTARYIKQNLKRNDQIIMFTASMLPLTGFAPSDASFS